ncbi:hypothetical protein WSS_A33500 [Rhodococcus opacus M213]|uniref:Uncharacterized protein n=1 Tax=Rhodococcus opacus M213 TaxID=1129896 RepID=K8XMK1_RHOOP|nr:hypothetical protein WSS_A33500 [Rhodococcus opacus M213]
MAAAGSAGRPHRHKERIPPWPAAIAAAEALRCNTSGPGNPKLGEVEPSPSWTPSPVIALST